MSARVFRNGEPAAATAEEVTRRLAAMNLRPLLRDLPPGLPLGDQLGALYFDAQQIVDTLDQQKGDPA